MATTVKELSGMRAQRPNANEIQKIRMEQLYDDVIGGRVSAGDAISRVSRDKKLALEASKNVRYLIGISQGGVLLAHIVAAYGSDRARDNLMNHGDKVLLAIDSTKTPVENIIYVHGNDAQREKITTLRKGRTWVQSFLRSDYSIRSSAPTIILSVSNMALFSHSVNILLLLSTNVSLYFYLQRCSKNPKIHLNGQWARRNANKPNTAWSQEARFYFSSGIWSSPA